MIELGFRFCNTVLTMAEALGAYAGPPSATTEQRVSFRIFHNDTTRPDRNEFFSTMNKTYGEL